MIIHNYLLSCLFVIVAYVFTLIVGDEAILGGTIADEHKFPYVVSIFSHDIKSPVCGGVIIDDLHILTVSHCFLYNGKFRFDKLHVLAGTNNLRKSKEPAVIVEVAMMYTPETFNSFLQNSDADIAILELKQSLELKKNKRYIRKAKFPKREESYVGKTATIAGFGWNWMKMEDRSIGSKYGNNSDGYLRFAEAHVFDHNDCLRFFPNVPITKRDMCAQVKQHPNANRSVCKGDSGSPLIADNSTVIGILSRSPIICEERNQSGIYTRVTHYLTFIGNVLMNKLHKNIHIHQLET